MLKILMPYALHPITGKVTLPEWIKECFRHYFSEEVKIIAVGPGNEINIPDSPNFYRHIKEIADKYKTDVLLDIEGGYTHDFMFTRYPIGIRGLKIYWAIDTHQFLKKQQNKAKYFNVLLSAQKNACKSFKNFSNIIYWLPAGASIYEKDYGFNRNIPLAFVGNICSGIHKKRKIIIEGLKNKYPFFRCEKNLFLFKKAKFNSKVKIMMNISLNNDINFRVFESMMCGSMLITDEIINNGLEDLFNIGKELVTFKNQKDLYSKIDYYLSHDREREVIARAGQKIVEKHYTHKHICKKILNIIKGEI